jgi:hypothetical protein
MGERERYIYLGGKIWERKNRRIEKGRGTLIVKGEEEERRKREKEREEARKRKKKGERGERIMTRRKR